MEMCRGRARIVLLQVARLHSLQRGLPHIHMPGSNHHFLGTYQSPGTPSIVAFTCCIDEGTEVQSNNHIV